MGGWKCGTYEPFGSAIRCVGAVTGFSSGESAFDPPQQQLPEAAALVLGLDWSLGAEGFRGGTPLLASGNGLDERKGPSPPSSGLEVSGPETGVAGVGGPIGWKAGIPYPIAVL